MNHSPDGAADPKPESGQTTQSEISAEAQSLIAALAQQSRLLRFDDDPYGYPVCLESLAREE